MLASLCLLAILGAEPRLVELEVVQTQDERVVDELVAGGVDGAAIEHLRVLLRLWPQSSRRGVWRAKILAAVGRGGDREAFAHEAALLSAEILAARQRPRSADLAEAEDLAEGLWKSTMMTWHLKSQSAVEITEAAESAEPVYRLWFSLFGERPEAGDMHFFHGELLYLLAWRAEDLRDGPPVAHAFGSAADAYEASVARAPHGRWAEAAAELAVWAGQQALKAEGGHPSSQTPSEKSAPQPLTPTALRLVRLSDAYVAAWPAGRSVTEARFRAARAFCDAWHLDEAMARFLALIDAAPDSARAEIAANLILDIDNLREDWPALDVHARLFQRYTTPGWR